MEDKLKEKLVPLVEECLRDSSSCLKDSFLNNPQGVSLADRISRTDFPDKLVELVYKTFLATFELLEEEGILQERPHLVIENHHGDTGIAIFHKGRLVFSKFISLSSLNPTDRDSYIRTASSWQNDLRNGINGDDYPYEEEDLPWWHHR